MVTSRTHLLLHISQPMRWPPPWPPLQCPLCCCYRRCFPIGAMPRRGASDRRSRGAVNPPQINLEEDGRKVGPHVVTQDPRSPADKHHQRREEDGISIQDGDGEGGRRPSVAPPISHVVRLGFAVLPQTNFPSARRTRRLAASTVDHRRSKTAPMTSARRGRVAPTSTAFGRRAPCRARCRRRLPDDYEAGMV